MIKLFAVFIIYGLFFTVRGQITELKDYPEGNPFTDTLRIEQFNCPDDNNSFWSEMSFWDSDFFSRGCHYSVEVLKGHPSLTYKIWAHEGLAPLAVIIPGSGGHYSSKAATSLAWLFFSRGYSTLIISNVFNYEFMESAGSHPVPGYTPEDAKDVYNALEKIMDDVETRYGAERISSKIIVGMSLGGLHSLFISSIEKNRPTIGFDRYIAINPPVNMAYAVERIDRLMNIWRLWGEKELDNNVIQAGAFYSELLNGGFDDRDSSPVDRESAEFLIGLNFQIVLRNMIYSIHGRTDYGFINVPSNWFSRDDLYRQIDMYDFEAYYKVFLRKCYERSFEGKPFSSLSFESGIFSIANELDSNPRVRVLHNANDFLLRKQDIKWIFDTFGEKAVVFNTGGHLGNLFMKKVQDTIHSLVERKAFKGFYEESDPRASGLFYSGVFDCGYDGFFINDGFRDY